MENELEKARESTKKGLLLILKGMLKTWAIWSFGTGVLLIIVAFYLYLFGWINFNLIWPNVLISLLTNFGSALILIALSYLFFEIKKHEISNIFDKTLEHLGKAINEQEKLALLKAFRLEISQELDSRVFTKEKIESIENRISEVESNIKTFSPDGTCPIDSRCIDGDHCPVELKEIRKSITNILLLNDSKKNYYASLISKRLKRLSPQFSGLLSGSWPIHKEDDRSPTDADIAYTIVREVIVENNPNAWIKASTIFLYMPWWKTKTGLRYLEGQRNIKFVERLFVFPDKFIKTLFPEASMEIQNKEEVILTDKETFSEGLQAFRDMTQWILILHWCLNVKVKLISKCFFANTDPRVIVDRWSNTDIAFFGDEKFQNENPICAIEAMAAKGEEKISYSLNPQEGEIKFNCSDKLSEYKHLYSWGIDFDIFLELPEVRSKFDLLENKIQYAIRKKKNDPDYSFPSLITNTVLSNFISTEFERDLKVYQSKK
jgi:hypothetical protein